MFSQCQPVHKKTPIPKRHRGSIYVGFGLSVGKGLFLLIPCLNRSLSFRQSSRSGLCLNFAKKGLQSDILPVCRSFAIVTHSGEKLNYYFLFIIPLRSTIAPRGHLTTHMPQLKQYSVLITAQPSCTWMAAAVQIRSQALQPIQLVPQASRAVMPVSRLEHLTVIWSAHVRRWMIPLGHDFAHRPQPLHFSSWTSAAPFILRVMAPPARLCSHCRQPPPFYKEISFLRAYSRPPFLGLWIAGKGSYSTCTSFLAFAKVSSSRATTSATASPR